MFEKHRKNLIQHCERSELRLHLAVKQCYQTGKSFIGQKLMENAKIEKLKCDILGDFQTLWNRTGFLKNSNETFL